MCSHEACRPSNGSSWPRQCFPSAGMCTSTREDVGSVASGMCANARIEVGIVASGMCTSAKEEVGSVASGMCANTFEC